MHLRLRGIKKTGRALREGRGDEMPAIPRLVAAAYGLLARFGRARSAAQAGKGVKICRAHRGSNYRVLFDNSTPRVLMVGSAAGT